MCHVYEIPQSCCQTSPINSIFCSYSIGIPSPGGLSRDLGAMLCNNYSSEHPTIRAYCCLTFYTVITHFYSMLFTLLFHFLVSVHRAQEMLYVIDEPLAIGKAIQKKRLTTMWALRL